jgi:hydrogenase-4 component B
MFMDTLFLLQSTFWLFASGAVLSILYGMGCKKASNYISGGLGILASICGILSASFALLQHQTFVLGLPFLAVPLADTHLIIDPLAAFFILVICIGALPLSIYSIGYVKSEYLNQPVGLLGGLYHLFLLSMLLVVTAANALMFLIFWECMALLSFCLVIFDSKSITAQKAGFLYLIMTHIGTAFILVLFLTLSQLSGSLNFASFHSGAQNMPESLRIGLFLFSVIGFGAKAGIVPLHIWLPEAHPQAPSHISALMSGVMIKMAIYGLFRVVFEFLSPFPMEWGLILVVIGLITALLGIVYASVENDLKRLLAYSSIENVGIIIAALGAGMMFINLKHPHIANIILMAGLFHILNHTLFKGLLFMVAGAILSVTHTRSLENLGGLIHKMPQTIFLFLIGVLSISAFPPFNGFASEWLIYQSLLSAIQLNSHFYQVFFILAATALGLVGAIGAATFVKTFSTASLALPRSRHAMHVHEVSPPMRYGMGLSAVLCLLFGLFPSVVLSIIRPVIAALTHQPIEHRAPIVGSLSIVAGDAYTLSLYSPLLLLGLIVCLMPIGYLVIQVLGGKTATRIEETWSCGVTAAPEFEYTATGFSQPLERAFSKLYGTLDIYYKYLYLPVVKGLIKLAHHIKVIQLGSLQVYLLYFLLTLIFCLIWIQLR